MGRAQLAGARYDSTRDCPDCGRSRYVTPDGYVITCKRRDCAGFSERWGRDQTARLKHNLAAWRHFAQMFTLTAPGKDVLPFDSDLCGHASDGSQCSGPAGCVVRPIQAAEWNGHEHERWTRALRAARIATKRKGVRVSSIRVLAYVVQIERGVAHRHVALGWTGDVRPGEMRMFLSQLRRAARREGYGRQMKAGRISHGSAEGVGSYLARYMAKAGFGALAAVPARVRPVYVSTILTRETGITMRFLRMARRAWRQWGVHDYGLLVRFFRDAERSKADPFTWMPLPTPRRRGPPRAKWVPIAEPMALPPSHEQLVLSL